MRLARTLLGLSCAAAIGGCGAGGDAPPDPGAGPTATSTADGGGGGSTSDPGADDAEAPSGPAAHVAVTLGTTTFGATMNAHFAGLSYEKGYLARPLFTPSNTNAVALFKLLGPNLVRIGGGSCDTHAWTAGGPGQTQPQIAPPDVDALEAFLTATDWDALYCVNLATSTPALAAAEVAYAARKLGDRLVGVEIGNEPDNYSKNFADVREYQSGWGPTPYATKWTSFAKAVLAAVPNVELTTPALSAFAQDAKWLPPLFATDPKARLMTQHFYIESASASGATIATLLGGAGIPTKDLVAVHDATTRGGAPYRMAETNTFYQGGKPGVSDAFASALWSIDYLFAIAENGGVGANFESLGANPSTPLADQNGSISEVRPLFYGLVFFTLAGPGRVLKTTTPSTNAAVSVHGLARTAGGTSLFVVNKDATHPADVTVDLGRPVTSASARALTAPSLDAKTGVAIQGSTIGLDGAFAPKPPSKVAAAGHAVTLIVPPGSAALVDVP